MTEPGRHHPSPPRRQRRDLPFVLLLVALAGVAAVTLRPVGEGWAWGAPAAEIRWYLGGLDSPATLRQLLGNLLLLAPAAAAAVVWKPRLARVRPLVTAALAVSLSIEVLQWVLTLGRVVSPTDAVLNTVGAVLAGVLTARVSSRRVKALEEATGAATSLTSSRRMATTPGATTGVPLPGRTPGG